jgi:hypothetical protein
MPVCRTALSMGTWTAKMVALKVVDLKVVELGFEVFAT